MRFLIACGGTGGHFYPGYVLGKTLIARGHEALFLLRSADPARRTLDAEDLPYAELNLRGLPRTLSPALLAFPFRLAASFWTAYRILRAYRPSAAAGMGGYLTVPVAAAARLRKIPVLLHESNAVLGLANRLCARWARRLALGLPIPNAPGNARLTGTPVRVSLDPRADSAAAKERLGLNARRPTILVFGGSQGAASINRCIPEAVVRLARKAPESLQVVHLAGAAGEERVRAAYAAAGPDFKSRTAAYAEEMSDHYAAADLVVSRSGASTVAELIALKKPALLIPYPHAAAGHQERNAEVLSGAGAALLRRDSGISPGSLARDIESLLRPGVLEGMSRAYARLDVPAPARSAGALADLLLEIARLPG